jgi:beta-phosphoglucomutase-like phosphatase (HAD superfamily)
MTRKIVPGAIEFVRWAAQHYRLALATSATPRNRLTTLNRLGIANLFEVGAGSIGAMPLAANLSARFSSNPRRRST